MSGNFKLKKTPIVQVIALMYMLAPLVIVYLTLLNYHPQGLVNVQTFMETMQIMTQVDFLWLGLIFMTGLMMLIVHKLSWSVALVGLFFIFIVNLFTFVHTSRGLISEFYRGHSSISVITSLVIIVFGYFYKYPYVDLRGGIFRSVSPRFNLVTPVIVVKGIETKGETHSVSLSGLMVQVEDDLTRHLNPQEPFAIVKMPSIAGLELKAKVIDLKGNRLRLEFFKPTKEQKRLLGQWISENTSSKAST